MQSVVKNVTFISKSMREFTNKETGESRIYYKALFVQDDSEPLEISISEPVFDALEKFQEYDLTLDISSYNRKFYCTVEAVNVA